MRRRILLHLVSETSHNFNQQVLQRHYAKICCELGQPRCDAAAEFKAFVEILSVLTDQPGYVLYCRNTALKDECLLLTGLQSLIISPEHHYYPK